MNVFNLKQCCSLAMLGFAIILGVFTAQSIDDQLLASQWHKRKVLVTGVVVDVPQAYQQSLSFYLKVKQVQSCNQNICKPVTDILETNALLKVTIFKSPAFESSSTQIDPVSDVIKLGQTWQLPVVLRKPRGFANSGLFHPLSNSIAHGLFAQARLDLAQCANLCEQVKSASNKDLQSFALQWRQSLRVRILQRTDPGVARALILALLVGDTSELGPYRSTLSRSGISHLLAVSGMHVTMIAVLAAAIGWGLWSWGLLPIWQVFKIPYRYLPEALSITLLTGFVGAFAYAMITGFGLPAQRALIALGVCFGARYWYGQTAWFPAFVIALMGVLLLSPYAPLGLDFWFSFGAIGLLIVCFAGQYKRTTSPVIEFSKAQLLITIGLLPLAIMISPAVHLMSPLFNALAIPLMQICWLPLLLFALIADFVYQPLSQLLFDFATDSFELAFYWLEYALVHWSSLHFKLAFTWQESLGLLCALLIITLPSLSRLRWLGAVAIVGITFGFKVKIPDAQFQVNILDVGQGSTIFIQTRHHNLLFDTGPKRFSGRSAAETILVPWLKKQGVSQLHALVLSHDDIAHISGSSLINAEFAVAKIYHAAGLILDKTPAAQQKCYNKRWQWDGVTFEFLPRLTHNKYQHNANHMSCVLKVANAQHQVLLLSDIEKPGEAEIINHHYINTQIPTALMTVPNHGSKTSSSTGLINVIKPKYALASAGYLHPYGHPHAAIKARYINRAIQFLNTAEDGAVTWQSWRSGIQRHRWDRRQQGLW